MCLLKEDVTAFTRVQPYTAQVESGLQLMLVVAAMLGDQYRPDSACGAAQEASSGMSVDSLRTILTCQPGSVSDLRHIQLPVRGSSVSMV